MKCPYCNATDHESDAQFCYACGTGLIQDEELNEREKPRDTSGDGEPEQRADSLYQDGMTYYRSRDFKNAVPLLLESAQLGNSNAQATIAKCYETGRGVTRNAQEALRWAMACAQQNNPYGQMIVGVNYLYGFDVEKNFETAFNWFRKSAKSGYGDGMAYLGFCYYHGLGVEKNDILAYDWIIKAAKKGSVQGKQFLSSFYGETL